MQFYSNGKIACICKNNNGPLLASFTEHLLGLEILPLLENHGADVLGGRRSGIIRLLDAVDEGDSDLWQVVIGAALHLDLTSRVGLLRLWGVALG
nr:hypothetical protein TorRG33x02_102480 [Ipomoea batatas]